MRIHLASGAACPHALVEDLLQHVEDIEDLELMQGLTLPPAPWLDRKKYPGIKTNAFYLDARLSELVNQGDADYSPVHYSDIPTLYRDGTIRIDAALIMVSPPDEYGYCSLGPSVEWTPAAIETARVVIAQVNPEMPRTGGLSHVHVSKIHYALEFSAPLPELISSEEDPVFSQIGEYAAQLIRNGDTLQFGVGPVGDGLAAALRQHRHLGIHSEVIGNGVMNLFKEGVIDNSRKTLLPGKVVASHALGTSELYSFLNTNPHFDFRPADFTNNPISIARNEHMVSVNGALLMDLTGQTVVDSVQGLFRSGVGSMVDFVRGAAMSLHGRPIIALASSGVDDEGKRFSRIVADLPMGAGVGCNRSDVHYVVTEHGIASLRGRTIQERVQELIQIAHPDFREDLLKKAREHHLVPPYFQLPPPYKDAAHGIRIRKIVLRDEQEYILRPLGAADDRRLQEFFYSHTEETIVRRYGFTVTRMSRERAFELVGIDQNHDLAIAIVELQGPRQVIHAVGRYYLDADKKGAEMAFVVSESKRRVGMARTLLESMLETAHQRGLTHLWAQVDRDNTPMMGLFRKMGAEEKEGDDMHTVHVDIPLTKEVMKEIKKPKKAFHLFRNRSESKDS
ncbi:GNAT family N-acetyltransferase [Puniceicoccales bacterium CK1056]|uniref:GNAT family N-acetyltransferase n=1 Tax=Oceanipulchritudo coccoides TaxID=2706888 RepID=A0A6B2M311_9BACT|nr:bifunctional acetyl-CoA hydrolase/transferase family protein/GNAT family N-acetyltransferase [Oceanipulchritudo coccoides]NDV62090.1 GNAT family N-acetyltransferase [Oceanipulchritudo coccoides]